MPENTLSLRRERYEIKDVDIEARFSREYLRKEQAIVTIRDRRMDWLLKLASQELSADEYTELSNLVAIRVTRSEREAFLTEKVLAARRARECQLMISLVSPEYNFQDFCRCNARGFVNVAGTIRSFTVSAGNVPCTPPSARENLLCRH
jgi:hypothetical protein